MSSISWIILAKKALLVSSGIVSFSNGRVSSVPVDAQEIEYDLTAQSSENAFLLKMIS